MVLKVFIDTDVFISSLISKTGAAYLLLNKTKNIKLVVSDLSVLEIDKVAKRLKLDPEKAQDLIDRRFSQAQLIEPVPKLKAMFGGYVLDEGDVHIVAGAKKAKVKFLISYNIKHFRADKLKRDFDIILITPANFLQYLRSS